MSKNLCYLDLNTASKHYFFYSIFNELLKCIKCIKCIKAPHKSLSRCRKWYYEVWELHNLYISSDWDTVAL